MARLWKMSLVGLLLGCAAAQGQVISGNVKWTDSAGGTHNSRRVRVDIIEENPLLGSGFVASTMTDLDGDYTLGVPFRPGATGYTPVIVAENDAGYVNADGAASSRYAVWGGFRFLSPTNHIDTVIGSASNAENSFGIVDAMYTSWRFGASGRAGDPAPGPVACMFPAPVIPALGTVPYWDGTKLNIIAGGQNDWDTAEHEYTHYLSSLDPLDHYAGAAHTFTISSIPTLGKGPGMRLAWGEGLADWGGIAAQHFDAAGGHMPVGVPNVGDTSYHDTVQGFSINLETSSGSGLWAMNNGGEGDEASIMRILWDIGDPANEAHDRVALGHDTLFRQLRAIDIPVTGGGTRGVQSLHDVWDHFTGGTADTATRVNYGAIFEKYGVSPEPTDDFAHPPLLDTGGAPTFHWLRQNNGANDTFELLVFTSDLSTELLDVLIPGNVTAWTMDAGDWASLAFSPGTYKYVIVGGDGLSSTGAPLALADRTLGYWSDAYDLVVVPAPGALAVCGVFVLVCRRRTRAT